MGLLVGLEPTGSLTGSSQARSAKGSVGGIDRAPQSLSGDVRCHFQKDPPPPNFLWPMLDLSDDLLLKSRICSADGGGGSE